MPNTVCARCGMSLVDQVDCPAGYPEGCAMKAAARLPAAVEASTQPVAARARGALAEGAGFAVLELVGLMMSPVTIGAAGMVTSLIGMLYVSARDLEGGRWRVVPRPGGARVVDAETGLPASEAQALQRNLPLALAWSLAILPDPLGLLGWVAVGFMVALDAMLVLVRQDRRRLGDLLAGTAVVSEEEG